MIVISIDTLVTTLIPDLLAMFASTQTSGSVPAESGNKTVFPEIQVLSPKAAIVLEPIVFTNYFVENSAGWVSGVSAGLLRVCLLKVHAQKSKNSPIVCTIHP